MHLYIRTQPSPHCSSFSLLHLDAPPSIRLLERLRADNGGNYPETVAFTLWGTDNIKTYGESLAQVRTAPLRHIYICVCMCV